MEKKKDKLFTTQLRDEGPILKSKRGQNIWISQSYRFLELKENQCFVREVYER